MIKIFIATLLIKSMFVYSQNRIRVLDAENHKPIPYAKLILKDKDYYKNTEEDGGTVLDENEDLSEIQSFGYENLKVEKFQQTYLLQPKFNEIKTVELRNQSLKNLLL